MGDIASRVDDIIEEQRPDANLPNWRKQSNPDKAIEKLIKPFSTIEMVQEYNIFLQKKLNEYKTNDVFYQQQHEQDLKFIQELKDEIIKIKSKR